MNRPVIHSRRECRMKKKAQNSGSYRFECAAVPVGGIENIYFAGCQVNKSESRDLFPDIG